MRFSSKKERPLILITNDDGIKSPGLRAAAQAALELGDILIAAPDHQYSGMGRAFPKTEDLGIIEKVPFEINGVSVPAYSVHGSPAYAVAYGIMELADRKPDLCISGINYGENMGMILTCSGTLGAAFEASSEGVMAVAVSAEVDLSLQFSDKFIAYDWEPAKSAIKRWALWALENRTDSPVDVLNINVPVCPLAPEEYRITTQSRQNYFEFFRPLKRDLSKPYRLRARKKVDLEHLEKDSDIYAVYVDKVISVTPVTTVMSLDAHSMGEKKKI